MNCPICGKRMTSGRLYGALYAHKWLPDPKRLFLGIWVIGGQPVDSRTLRQKFWVRPYADGHKCETCQKIILDLKGK
jgi:hypothetical protein